jgi:hypothetical protein
MKASLRAQYEQSPCTPPCEGRPQRPSRGDALTRGVNALPVSLWELVLGHSYVSVQHVGLKINRVGAEPSGILATASDQVHSFLWMVFWIFCCPFSLTGCLFSHYPFQVAPDNVIDNVELRQWLLHVLMQNQENEES